jgi:hypothetical protein
MMGKFEIGQWVTVNDTSLTDHYGEIGKVKELLGGHDLPSVIKVEFDDGIVESFVQHELAPAASAPAADAGDSVFVGIERRIMKSGDTRFLEGIDEPMGTETARYINNLSIELHNMQKVVSMAQADLVTAQQRIRDLEARLAAMTWERDAMRDRVSFLEKFYAIFAMSVEGAISQLVEFGEVSREHIDNYQEELELSIGQLQYISVKMGWTKLRKGDFRGWYEEYVTEEGRAFVGAQGESGAE